MPRGLDRRNNVSARENSVVESSRNGHFEGSESPADWGLRTTIFRPNAGLKCMFQLDRPFITLTDRKSTSCLYSRESCISIRQEMFITFPNLGTNQSLFNAVCDPFLVLHSDIYHMSHRSSGRAPQKSHATLLSDPKGSAEYDPCACTKFRAKKHFSSLGDPRPRQT